MLVTSSTVTGPVTARLSDVVASMTPLATVPFTAPAVPVMVALTVWPQALGRAQVSKDDGRHHVLLGGGIKEVV
jgi:hypothetical protein